MGSRDRLPVICQGLLTLLRRFLVPTLVASLLCCGAAAQTYQANLGPAQGLRSVLREVHRSDTGQAVYVFALPKKR